MIANLSDLKKLMQLCRKQGISEISIEGITFKLGELPNEASHQSQEVDQDDPYAGFPDGELSATQLMYYSAGGLPENDPERKADQ